MKKRVDQDSLHPDLEELKNALRQKNVLLVTPGWATHILENTGKSLKSVLSEFLKGAEVDGVAVLSATLQDALYGAERIAREYDTTVRAYPELSKEPEDYADSAIVGKFIQDENARCVILILEPISILSFLSWYYTFFELTSKWRIPFLDDGQGMGINTRTMSIEYV